MTSAQPRLLVFGPQAKAWTERNFSDLRAAILSSPNRLQWALEVIAELPSLWDDVSGKIPALQFSDASARLEELRTYFTTDEHPVPSAPVSNLILTPLVVLLHLTQFAQTNFLDTMQEQRDSTTLGLCTGLLSALAVSASSKQEDLDKWGPVAVRLGLMVGGVVDSDDMKDEAQSVTVTWSPGETTDKLHTVLEQNVQRYISVLFDDKRATVTTAKSDSITLVNQLKAAGLSVGDVRLKGRFHSIRHEHVASQVIGYCSDHPGLQLPLLSELAHPTLVPSDVGSSDAGKLHVIALQAILTHQAMWYESFAQACSVILQSTEGRIACFGPERCVPPSLLPELKARLVPLNEIKPGQLGSRDTHIAVIGMAVRVPGAADIDQFSSLLREGRSQHTEVPSSRFRMDTHWRPHDPAKRRWYGNFLDDVDSFDHRFFKKTPREAASMDPQHRLILETAYQALEQAGYFRHRETPDRHIGCFLGVGLVDYENNIACHPANAYSATGNLKSFAAGRISHYFGWTGPALTLDTACSSSAVAVHQACRAILHGECSTALAGAVNLMTSPDWFHNLAGASFLSPTGQCKPFDRDADGYCRGEAVGALVLKSYSAAVADNDQILGVIAASEVFQNENCTPITVPNAISLSALFRTVVKQAGLEPAQISVVEAHGTGTPVGDPAEYDSIRQVFATGTGSSRVVSLGSVKGLVGHGEPASGMTALIKILLMAREGFIPPQPSHKALNPAIEAHDQIEIATALKPWTAEPRVALINNYGASGSNASLVVMQAPVPHRTRFASGYMEAGCKHPFWLSALDQASVRRYASRLRQFIARNDDATDRLGAMSFALSRQSNRTLTHAAIFSASSMNDLDAKLSAIEQGSANPAVVAVKDPRPVILCFGGQISTFVGLDRAVYERISILRHHLDTCNKAALQLGLPPIYPAIFQQSPVESIVQLQTMLFSLQYSCGRTWIDCGVDVAAVVGHSFGELSALCVAGGLGLREGLRMVSGRALLIEDAWPSDRGQMMAVEGDLHAVQQVLGAANKSTADGASPASIACFNGPRTFTLAGSTQSLEKVSELLKDPQYNSSIRGKKLDVTNAFHSALVDPLIPGLKDLSRSLDFRHATTIPWERAVDADISKPPGEDYIAEHMRGPVHFMAAVQRLAKRYPAAVWLEAGSRSTVTSLASRALGLDVRQASHFQAVDITTDGALQSLVEATTSLWGQGIPVDFWPHHATQTYEYPLELLPSYQFEHCPHWLELKMPEVPAIVAPKESQPAANTSDRLWSLVQHPNAPAQGARFQIHTNSTEYQDLLAGHVVVQTGSICPSIFQIEFVIDALTSLRPEFQQGSFRPQLLGMQSHGPMGTSQTAAVWLDVQPVDVKQLTWHFHIGSESSARPSAKLTPHASGRIVFVPANEEQTQAELQRFERLVTHSRCRRLLDGNGVDEAMQGRSIYKTFADIVTYSSGFKGLRKIVSAVSSGSDSSLCSAGQVDRLRSSSSSVSGSRYVDTGLLDAFCQVAGIYINCLNDVPADEMYISDRIERWIRTSLLHGPDGLRPESFDVFAVSQRTSDREILSDVYVFEPSRGIIVEAILGIHYQRLPRATMRQIVARVNGLSVDAPSTTAKSVGNNDAQKTEKTTVGQTTAATQLTPPSTPPSSTGDPAATAAYKPDIFNQVRTLLCDLSGMDAEEIQDSTGLGDIGIDSLMGMEVAREVESTFNCSLDVSELENLTDVASLLRCIEGALGYSTESNAQANEAPEPAPAVPIAVPNGVHGAQDIPAVNGNGTDNAVSIQAAMETFAAIKKATDGYLEDYGLAEYSVKVLPKSTELCIVHILDAFDTLACSIRKASPGETLSRIPHLPRHTQFVDFVYNLLGKEGLVQVEGAQITRTKNPCPTTPAAQLVQELLADGSKHSFDHQLTWLVGQRLADCLVGKADGVHLIFGSPEGREAATGMYSQSPINLPWIKQMEAFLLEYVSRLDSKSGPIRILEMGAGTGGTTAVMAPVLASLGVELVYTATDLSSSLVAGLRKRFKKYPFMAFKTCNIEDTPPQDLLRTQHIVLATNCVHATQDLVRSTTNILQMLRPRDGLLMMLEMTEPLPWVDLVFGLVEGWWLFNDGRQHALAPPEVWERTLLQAGYGAVDWTDGNRPEAAIQRVILAMASPNSPRYNPSPALPPSTSADTARQATIDAYVERFTAGFHIPAATPDQGMCKLGADIGIGVLVTGATGSLGSHLVAHLAQLPEIKTVVCLNRPRGSSATADTRQKDAFQARGILLSPQALDKIHAFQADTSKPRLGLSAADYQYILQHVTHIVHNAWPMSLTRVIHDFTPQFQTLRNLLDLAAQMAARHAQPRSQQQHQKLRAPIAFQFISSIATVGQFSRRTGQTRVPETRMTAAAGLCTGYSEAKLVCEHMLDATLHRFPSQFRAMAVRIGQIAGSTVSAHWNPVEHLAFILKSAQALQCLPRLEGTLSWCPVDTVAATLSDLVLHPHSKPVYHIENPARQPWAPMLQNLSETLPAPQLAPFTEWTQKVRQFPGSLEQNPAARLVDFLEEHFVAMSCGTLILDTSQAKGHSDTLKKSIPVGEGLVSAYVARWREIGFLN
ncbi:polyketide synthase [Aspergillus pseudoustus]|uniref:Polyketide synthase n=1 Tax=Aspergillus pseudoustus TaxID=1810923 RepID=A0ABR4K6I1_9EURO